MMAFTRRYKEMKLPEFKNWLEQQGATLGDVTEHCEVNPVTPRSHSKLQSPWTEEDINREKGWVQSKGWKAIMERYEEDPELEINVTNLDYASRYSLKAKNVLFTVDCGEDVPFDVSDFQKRDI